MNQALKLHNQKLLLTNLMSRMSFNEKQTTYKLDGAVTQEERNAMNTGLQLIKLKIEQLQLGGKLGGKEIADD